MARMKKNSQTESQRLNSSRKRERQEDENQISRPSKRKFTYLKSQTRNISQEMIRSEWKSLPKPVQHKARDIFLHAKRMTLNQVVDGPKRREAEIAVNDVLRRLERQLPRMPFPAKTKTAQLDLDHVLEQTRVLESEKGPLNDSTRLLTEEIEREEARIESRRKELAKLEKAAKVAEKERKQRASITHSLLDGLQTSTNLLDNVDDIGLVDMPKPTITFDETDEDLAPLLDQLRNHLTSIKVNTQQITRVDDAIVKSRTALQAVLSQAVP